MRAQSVAIISALTLSVLGAACTSTKMVPAADSHAGADHADATGFGVSARRQSRTPTGCVRSACPA